MRLHWERKELSTGVYVYIVDDDTRALCYVRETTPRAREFIETLCRRPEMLPRVLDHLSPGKEVRAEVIEKLLREN